MNYCNIKRRDIADGIGVRVTLFVSGCTHHCKGCFQPETWDFTYGRPFDAAAEDAICSELALPFVNGLTLLGGEPFEPDNQRGLLSLLREVKQNFPDKTVWAYSGYTWEELTGDSRARCEVTDEVLTHIDVLVDGEFVEEQKDITLRFRGSRNQRILDVPRSLASGKPVEWDG